MGRKIKNYFFHIKLRKPARKSNENYSVNKQQRCPVMKQGSAGSVLSRLDTLAFSDLKCGWKLARTMWVVQG